MNASPRHHRLASWGLCAVVLTAGSGCGLLFTSGPPAGHERMVGFSCTESNTGPILDVVWAGLNVASALVAVAQPEGEFDYSPTSQEAVIAMGLGWGVLSSVSAVVGFQKTKACREAKLAMYERLRQATPRENVDAPSRIDPLVLTVRVTPLVDTLRVGQQSQLLAIAYGVDGTAIPAKPFRWSSSNDAIAAVSSGGLVTAHAEGRVVIAANADNVVGTAAIVVVP